MAQIVGTSERPSTSDSISAHTRASARLFHSCLLATGAVQAAEDVAKTLLSSYRVGLLSAASLNASSHTDVGQHTSGGFAANIPVSIANECGRFELWATNLGAHQEAQSSKSADHKLRAAPVILRRVIELQEQLQESLEHIRAIITGETPDQSEVSELIAPDSDGGSSASSDSLSVDDTTELDALVGTVAILNTDLMKTSILIRKGIETDRYVKASAARYRMDPSYDIHHVVEKFRKLPSEQDWLAKRLGRAITMRRQFLYYSIEHDRRLKHVMPQRRGDAEVEILVGPSVNATTRPTLRNTATSTVRLDDLIERYAATSLGTRNSSLLSSRAPQADEDQLRVPDVQQVSKGQDQFECPYCCTIIAPKNRSDWKSHVFSDLRPYVCTFPDCDTAMFTSRHAWFEHELSVHRCSWLCPFCKRSAKPGERNGNGNDSTSFKSRLDLRQHIHADHEARISDSDMLDAILGTCSVPTSEMPADSCPLCDEEWCSQPIQGFSTNGRTVTAHSLRDHIATHQEQLALFAIASNKEGDASDSSEEAEPYDGEGTVYGWLDEAIITSTATEAEAQLRPSESSILRDSSESALMPGEANQRTEVSPTLPVVRDGSNPGDQRHQDRETTAASPQGLPEFLRKSKAERKTAFVDLEWAQRERLLSGTAAPELGSESNNSPWKRLTGEAITSRNRYMNVEPYASNRVKLSVPARSNDYINASPILLGNRRYIATQGPTASTVYDFYRMLGAECRRPVIIMLTKTHEAGREKCYPYYPESIADSPRGITASEDGSTAIVTLSNISEEPETRCTVRHMQSRLSPATGDVVQQDILHLHFSGWPDFLIPEGDDREALVRLCLASARLVGLPGPGRGQEYDDEDATGLDPRIVHCSAGVGRTGTFIALDYLLYLADTGQLDDIESSRDVIAETVDALRKQRMMMVQGESQFNLLYELLRSRMETRSMDLMGA